MHPMAAGYVQNPISIYYCYSAGGELTMCIAEVTNTPWCVQPFPDQMQLGTHMGLPLPS